MKQKKIKITRTTLFVFRTKVSNVNFGDPKTTDQTTTTITSTTVSAIM